MKDLTEPWVPGMLMHGLYLESLFRLIGLL